MGNCDPGAHAGWATFRSEGEKRPARPAATSPACPS